MRLSTFFLSVFLIGLMFASVLKSQDIGDYGSITSGNWGTAATTWAAWDGTGFNTAVTSQPSSSVNVYVRNGHTITLEGSGKNCKNLIIEEGGTLVADASQPTSNIRYVRVAGATVINNGTIGTLDNLNAISFEILDSTAFQGTGISRICRVRPRTDSTNVHIVFDTDVTLTYVGGTGTGGVGLYTANSANNDNIIVTVNAGKTVTCVNYCYVAIGSSGTGNGSASSTFNINGSLILEGENTNMNLRVVEGKNSTLNVNGVLTTGRNLNTVSSDGVVPTITVNGELTVQSGNCELSAPTSVITGIGTVNILGNTNLQIGSAEGITTSGNSGAIQTSIRNFSTDGRFTYMGTAAQVTGNALPAVVDELTINNAEGVTLNGNIEIAGALNLNSGILTTGEFSVKLGDGTDVNRTSGHVNGPLSKTITGGGTFELFDIGDAAVYTPVSVTFGNITTAGVLTAVSKAENHPNILTSDITAYQNVDRYYTLTNDGIVYDNYSAEFTFVPEDLDEGTDTAAFMVQKYASGTWSTPTVANPLATSIGIIGEVGFGDFIIGEEKAPFLVTDYFRSKTSGNWNDPAVWEASPDNVSWIDATEAPYDTANIITINAGDTVTVTETVSVDQIVVEENGVIVIEGSPVVFTLRDGSEDVDMTVSGKILVAGTAIASPGPYSFNAEGVIHFEATSVYEHNQNAGSIPVSVWKEGSTLLLSGIVGNAPGNRSQNFSNIIYNCPDQTANLNMGFTDAVISGDINVVNTGTGRWQLCAPATGTSASVNILGDIIQTGGNFTSHGTGNGNTTIIIHTQGDITTTAGNFSVTRGSQAGTGTTEWYLHGDLSMSNTTTQNSNAAGAKFIFTGEGTHQLTLDNVTFSGGFPVEVDSTVLDLGTSQIFGSGIFTLTNTSSLICANAGGLDSALQTTGVITLSSEADYIFNGTTAQITGLKLPDLGVRDLGINNPAGVTLSNNIQVNNELEVVAGNLLLNNNIVTLGSTANLIETGGYVTGTSGKITTTREINAPASLNVGGLGAVITSAANFGSTVVERLHSAAQGLGNSGIFRQYNIAPANNTSLNATLRFHYIESELNSIPEANLRIFSSPDGAESNWDLKAGTINTTDNYAEISGLNSLSYWTLADVNNPVPVEMNSFAVSSDQYDVILNWSTATEIQNRGWDIERRLAEEKEWLKIGFTEGKGTSTEPSEYQFRDAEAVSGTYQYRLKQMDYNGAYSYSGIVEIDVNNMPLEFALHQNYPNPFNPETVIRFDLPEESFINFSIYNSIGEKVLTIINEKMEKGRYTRTFNALNFPSGIYIYRLTSDNSVFTKKMMLIK